MERLTNSPRPLFTTALRSPFALSWASVKHDKIVDLDEFVDGAAVMFPLTDKASAVTMGSETDPVNAWYWKANRESRAFDVVARGYGTSARSSSDRHPIMSAASHADGRWSLVLTRSLDSIHERVQFPRGTRRAWRLPCGTGVIANAPVGNRFRVTFCRFRSIHEHPERRFRTCPGGTGRQPCRRTVTIICTAGRGVRLPPRQPGNSIARR